MALAGREPIDRATLAYVAVALVFSLAHGPGAAPYSLPALLGLLLAGVLAGVVAPGARRPGERARFLPEFYPLFLTVAFYADVGLVNASRGVRHDAVVQGWEQWLFSGSPSTAWIRAFPDPAWSTLMHGAYLSYYPIVVGVPLALWLSGRRLAARQALLLTMVAFYLCYTAFLIFPVAGPRYLLPPAANAATDVPIARLTRRLLAGGSAWGTAFPSSHVAVAVVAAGCGWRAWPRLRALFPLAALLLALGTVYGQFHYAVDALAGAAVGLAVLIVGSRAGYDLAPRVARATGTLHERSLPR
jgi:membrane-associated phospholipid phosphatase